MTSQSQIGINGALQKVELKPLSVEMKASLNCDARFPASGFWHRRCTLSYVFAPAT